MPLQVPNMKKNTKTNDQQVRAVLYVERITDLPLIEGYSLREQEKRLQKFCRINGFTVAGTYRDTVESDFPEQYRPGFRRMLREIDRSRETDNAPDRVNTLLVVMWHHFSREYDTACTLRSMLRAHGVFVQAIDEPLRTNGAVAEQLLAHYYDAVNDMN